VGGVDMSCLPEDKQKLKVDFVFNIYRTIFGVDFMDTLQSENIVSFGSKAFLIAVNGLPQKRAPIDPASFNFRKYSFNELEGGDFFNLSEEEYVYLLANSVAVR
jgi:hypothetical protein